MTADPPVAGDPGETEDSAEELLLGEVDEALAGKRLDAAAARLFPDYSRARLQHWIELGRLRVNGEPATRGRDPVRLGDQLELEPEPLEDDGRVLPQDLPLTVVHADAQVLVLDKPAGLTVHPGAGKPDGTLQNALLHHYPQTAGLPRSGIVHRLDKDTSGLLVVALTLPAHTHLVAQLARRSVKREYDAVITGTPVVGGTVHTRMGRDPRSRLKMAVTREGDEAITHWQIQARYPHHCHIRVRLETGRTHQIRVHMAHLRTPIVGDGLYGGRIARGQGMSPALREVLLGFKRQALHARELAFTHPRSGKTVQFSAPLPADMQALLAALARG